MWDQLDDPNRTWAVFFFQHVYVFDTARGRCFLGFCCRVFGPSLDRRAGTWERVFTLFLQMFLCLGRQMLELGVDGIRRRSGPSCAARSILAFSTTPSHGGDGKSGVVCGTVLRRTQSVVHGTRTNCFGCGRGRARPEQQATRRTE